MHRRVGEGLFDDAGKTRVVEIGPTGMAVVYCPCRMVENRLRILVEFVQSRMARGGSLEYRIRLGALLISEFLFIHPFRNGNGRTARVLLNAMLRTTMIYGSPLRTLSERATDLVGCIDRSTAAEEPRAAKHIPFEDGSKQHQYDGVPAGLERIHHSRVLDAVRSSLAVGFGLPLFAVSLIHTRRCVWCTRVTRSHRIGG